MSFIFKQVKESGISVTLYKILFGVLIGSVGLSVVIHRKESKNWIIKLNISLNFT